MIQPTYDRWTSAIYVRAEGDEEPPGQLIARELRGIVERRGYLRYPSLVTYVQCGEGLAGYVDARWLAYSEDDPVAWFARDRWLVYVDARRIGYLGYWRLEGHETAALAAWSVALAELPLAPFTKV